MHGFIGCVEQDPRASQLMLGWMRRWIALPPRQEEYEVSQRPFFLLATVDRGSSGNPIAHGDGGRFLVYDGFVCADQLAEPGAAQPKPGREVAEALLRGYEQKGPEALAGLNGRYVAAVWDSKSSTLELMNDALGYKPLFVWQHGAGAVFSSNVWPIACHPAFPRAVDPRGLVDLLLLEQQQGERTLYEGVSVLAPGAVTQLRDGRLTRRIVRNLRFSDERWTWSSQRAADTMHELLGRAVQRMVPDGSEVLLPLSGGLDSRVLLGLLSERPVRVHAVTHHRKGLLVRHMKGSAEARYAKRVARAAGVEHLVVPIPDDVYARCRERSVAISGGMYDIHTGRILSLLGQTCDGSIPVASGHPGGELTSRFQIPDSEFSNAEEHFRVSFAKANASAFTPETVKQMIAGRLDAGLIDESLGECRDFFMSHPGPYHYRFINWLILFRRRRYVSYQLFFIEQFSRPVAPFCDNDVLDFICSLPFALVEKQNAYLTMQRRHWPNLARIPNTTTGLPVLSSTRGVVEHFLWTQYGRFVRNPLQRLVSAASHGPEDAFSLRTASRSVLEHILAGRERLAPYLDPNAVRDAVDRYLNGDESALMGMVSLSALATALEMLEDPYRAIRAWEDGNEPVGAVGQAANGPKRQETGQP